MTLVARLASNSDYPLYAIPLWSVPPLPPTPHVNSDLQLRDGLCSVSEEKAGWWGTGVISYWAMLQINVWINYLMNERQELNRWGKANIWTLSIVVAVEKNWTYVPFSTRKFLVNQTEKAFLSSCLKKDSPWSRWKLDICGLSPAPLHSLRYQIGGLVCWVGIPDCLLAGGWHLFEAFLGASNS